MFNMGVRWAKNLKRKTEKWAVKLTRGRVQREVSFWGEGAASRKAIVSETGVGGKAKEGEMQWAINHRGERAVGLKLSWAKAGWLINLTVARVR